MVVNPTPPALRVSPTYLQFNYILGDPAPAAQSLRVDSSGAALTFNVTANSPWITTFTQSGTTPAAMDVKVNPAGLAAGTYRGQIVVTTPPLNSPPSTQYVDVALIVTVDNRPAITSVLNSASFKPVIGPGTWISAMGSNFSSSVAQASSTYLSTSLNGVSMQLRDTGGAYYLLMHYVSPTQVNAFVPHELPASFFNSPTAELAVTTSAGTSAFKIAPQALAPALFTYGNPRYAAAIHPDGVIVGTIAGTIPAKPGTIISVYGTGFGQTTPPISNVNGTLIPRVLSSEVAISIEGRPLQVLWAGMVGVGLYQFNIVLPADLPEGDRILTAQIAGLTTEGVTIPVRQ
jgi:uncharacterized protein (TIGR03437 family)